MHEGEYLVVERVVFHLEGGAYRSVGRSVGRYMSFDANSRSRLSIAEHHQYSITLTTETGGCESDSYLPSQIANRCSSEWNAQEVIDAALDEALSPIVVTPTQIHHNETTIRNTIQCDVLEP
jgi:hypothetical protein